MASRKVRDQYELAHETTGLETAMCVSNLAEGNALCDAGRDGASCQQPQKPLAG
jgi:hypothetical protein